MKALVTCKKCGAQRNLVDEPQLLSGLQCPSCQEAVDPRASEDLASAIEDALAQLWRFSRHADLQLTLDTRCIPAAFCPPAHADERPDWDDG